MIFVNAIAYRPTSLPLSREVLSNVFKKHLYIQYPAITFLIGCHSPSLLQSHQRKGKLLNSGGFVVRTQGRVHLEPV
jgi:hypothetical protein